MFSFRRDNSTHTTLDDQVRNVDVFCAVFTHLFDQVIANYVALTKWYELFGRSAPTGKEMEASFLHII